MKLRIAKRLCSVFAAANSYVKSAKAMIKWPKDESHSTQTTFCVCIVQDLTKSGKSGRG
jgi:hypothetical protein